MTSMSDDHLLAVKYFTRQDDSGTWKCSKCKRSLVQGNGYGNLGTHIRSCRRDTIDKDIEALRNLGPDATLLQSNKAEAAYKWISFIVDSNSPCDIVNQQCYRALVEPNHEGHSKDFVCSNTLMKYIASICEHVVDTIQINLPDQFGIALDGWTENELHFVAIFAVCPQANYLLAINQLPDPTNQKAENHLVMIKEVLEGYKKSLVNVAFIVADNTNVNPCLASLMETNFIGCLSHKLNLAVNYFLEICPKYQRLVDKIHAITQKLRSSANVAARLKLVANRCVVCPNITRWTSKFEMIKRYIELEENLVNEASYLEITNLLLTEQERKDVRELFEILQVFHDVTLSFQDIDFNLKKAYILCKRLSVDFPEISTYLDPSEWSTFQLAIAKILCNETLSEAEKKSVKRFEKQKSNDNLEPSFAPPTKRARASYSQQAYLDYNELPNEYEDLSFINPTSNIVERLFSVCKQIFSETRRRLTPDHLELLLMLKMNRGLWDLATLKIFPLGE